MDEKTKIMVALGASTAVNCIPCFQHYYGKAGKLGLTVEEIKEAVEVANRVKNGANLTIQAAVHDCIGGEKRDPQACGGSATSSCCP
jgi:alkylhydroperoxidase/carboxymuconolactone decarboxylase family protein YurZ